MENNKQTKIFSYLLMFFAIAIFVLLSFPEMINHITGFDEAHAWINAKCMNFSNYTKILSSEGHPILWYLLLMPFAKNNLCYPYPMYILNYIFCIFALLILWLKAPFNNYLKFVITISPIFTSFYGVVARNYTIGIILLFLAACLYKYQERNQILYSICLALIMQTHILCAIGASALFLIFLYKTLNSSKIQTKTILSILIFLSSFIIFIYPYFGGYSNAQNFSYSPPGLEKLYDFFIYRYYGINFILYSIISFIALKNSKDSLSIFFYSFTNLIMLILFGFFYGGTAHHYFMFYIYLIITAWIEKDISRLNSNFIYTVLLSVLLLIPIKSSIGYIYPDNNVKEIKNFISMVNRNKELENQFVFVDVSTRQIVPYLSNKIRLYDLYSANKFDWTVYTKPEADSLKLLNEDKVKKL